jgi:hypothetical protein
MRNSSAQFLLPGETIQEVFPGQTASVLVATLMNSFGLLGALVLMSFNKYRIFAVTDQRILVLDAGKFSLRKARGVVAQLPRGIRLGPPSRVWHVIDIGEEKVRVHRRFFKDIRAADDAVAAVLS